MELFNGEAITFEPFSESRVSDEELDRAYHQSNKRLIIDQGRYPVDQLVNMFRDENGRLKDDPEYQRGHVWGTDRKSKLIESLIMNIPVPPIYLFEKDYNQYEILDGKQRINSIVEFYSNEFCLEGLDVWTGLNGKYFDDLTPTFKNALNRSYISSLIIMKESVSSSGNNSLVRTIFERLNSGGVVLTTQESRNALMAGPFNDMCKSLASTDLFKEYWGLSKKVVMVPLFGNYKRIEDRETVLINYSEYPLRFFAFRQIEKMDTSLVSFLDEYLRNANKFPKELIDKMSKLYFETLSFANNLFINQRKINKESKNLYIQDPLMQSLSMFLDKKEKLLENKDTFIEKYLKAIKDKKLFNGKYSHKKIVLQRIDKFNEIISECVENVY